MRVVVLDLDMTLVETLPRFFEVLRTCAARRGFDIKVGVDELLRLYYMDPSLTALLDGAAHDFYFWHDCWLEYTRRGEHGIVYDGALDVIRWLRGLGKYVVIATGRELECSAFAGELRYYGFLDLIDYCVSLGDLGPGHDKRDLILHILSKYPVKPHELLYATDHPRDIAMTRDLGIVGVGVATYVRDFGTRYVIRSISELPMVVRLIDEGTY
ncbi:HAD family hydrolase [Vulcanisaeta thermophila]|uniref:HAD family hydrolase n=1 Tax=Vulcanisaeta thermophila TaxID=867917 RepID=UPI001EE1A73A|nr:HAD family hydrolase [Vulcanisaeta thermophila]